MPNPFQKILLWIYPLMKLWTQPCFTWITIQKQMRLILNFQDCHQHHCPILHGALSIGSVSQLTTFKKIWTIWIPVKQLWLWNPWVHFKMAPSIAPKLAFMWRITSLAKLLKLKSLQFMSVVEHLKLWTFMEAYRSNPWTGWAEQLDQSRLRQPMQPQPLQQQLYQRHQQRKNMNMTHFKLTHFPFPWTLPGYFCFSNKLENTHFLKHA